MERGSASQMAESESFKVIGGRRWHGRGLASRRAWSGGQHLLQSMNATTLEVHNIK